MRFRLRRGRRVAALSFALFAQTVVAQVQEPTWQVPVYSQLPSATDLGGQALSVTAGGARRLVLGASWTDAHTVGDEDHPRFLAIDAATGERVWQRDLDGPCGRQLYGEQFVATFANGDVAVANVSAHPTDWPVVRTSCYARLDAEGRVLWRYIDAPDPANPPGIRVRAIAVDRDGDLLATGYSGSLMRTLKLAGSDGTPRWVQDDSPLPVQSIGGVRVVGDATGTTVLAVAQLNLAGSTQQIVALDATDGHVLWRRGSCLPSSLVVDELRPLADGSWAFAESCGAGATAYTIIGRLAPDTGYPIWQRQIDQGNGRVEIDAAGNSFVIGDLNLDGQPIALARFAAADGRLEWATPGSINGPEPLPAGAEATLSTALGNGSVYVWELIGARYSIGVFTTRLSRYDAQSGQLLDRREINEPARDYLSRSARIHALPGGEVLLAGLSLYGGWAGNWLWLARADPAAGVRWSRREPVSAQRALRVGASGPSRPLMVASMAGTQGLVLAGRAIPSDLGPRSDGYPYLAKVAPDDGRELWRWQPEPVVPDGSARVDEILVDAAGQMIVAGYGADPQWSLAPLLAKVDAATGRTLWLRYEDSVDDAQPRGVALGAAGDPFVLSPQRLRRHAAADGRLLWETPMPDGGEGAGHVVVDASGDAIAAAAYDAGTASHGIQLAKFRGGDGTQLWLRRLPTTMWYPEVGSLVLLPGGDVALAATLSGSADLTLVRIAGGSGGSTWQRNDIGPEQQLLVDREGQIVLGGASGWPQAWRLARLNATNGATLWSKDFPGIGEGGAINRLALAPGGELLVAGHRAGAAAGLARVVLASGETRWTGTTAASMQVSGAPAGIVRSGDGSLFLAADARSISQPYTATLFRFAGPVADRVFGDGFD